MPALIFLGLILSAWMVTDSGSPPLDGAPSFLGQPWRPALDRLGFRTGAF